MNETIITRNTRFVDAYDQKINDENKVDWKLELKRWIAASQCQKQGILLKEVMTKKARQIPQKHQIEIEIDH